MSKAKKPVGNTSTDKDLEGISFNIEEVKVEITTKYLSSLEKKGAVVNGKPVPHKDFIKKEGFKKLINSERSYLYYLREKETIREAYEQSKDWDKVINSVVYVDSYESMEAFIDYVQEIYKTPVKDAKHLMKLTGCSDYKETEDVTLQETIYAGRYSKYYRALTEAVERGFKYNQLLKLKPKMYGLPKTWSKRGREFTQYKAILMAIDEEFCIGEPNISLLPNLRLIAKELEAPYSVIMDVFKETVFTPATKTTSYKKTSQDIKQSINEKILGVISKQSKTWKQERGLDNPKEEGYSWTLNFYKDGIFLVVQQLASNKISKLTGKPHKPPIDYAEDYLQFVGENFKEEIEEYVQLVINTAFKGQVLSKEFKKVVKKI